MSTTVTGSPPRGQTASQQRGSGARCGPRARRRFRLPRASTTPGTDGTLSLDAQQIYQSLADADVAVSTAYLSGRYNSLGYPAGGSFIQVASEEMHLAMLPAARGRGWGLTRRLAEYR